MRYDRPRTTALRGTSKRPPFCDCDRSSGGVTFDGKPQTMLYGTGVTLNDLYGNKIYLNEDRH
jgi:hypothetical protein